MPELVSVPSAAPRLTNTPRLALSIEPVLARVVTDPVMIYTPLFPLVIEPALSIRSTFPRVAKPPSLSPWINPPALLVTVPVVLTIAPQFTPVNVPELVSVPSVVPAAISNPLFPPWIRPTLSRRPSVPLTRITPSPAVPLIVAPARLLAVPVV